mmetsp:Transcript_32485/g.53722  ORF Transcript_32485/g.53722 Transcript_32485/m.53722 type:complete len:174 (+) Transcript_32485:130-651(+)|eukprot:CAMPEP_0119005350 /NCGR_PEP_ID=MMETSP1176-20130426/1663_1 /TAXON_ID=265551 /ORGANISM="Synedropsis recta cf, Strain CCMP1620" /LENGTH=173 /DNA_ID=CAMNT_0006957139 /DNA_START=123 /DNA_END=644 /DNA_ORIENTATION=+
MNSGMRLMRPHYVDPQTNIVYDTNDADFEGWLTKQSTWLKDWRRRYFILKGSTLFFAKTDYSAPHGMIDLSQCTTVKSADLKSKKRNSFEVSTPELTFLLYADTEKEKDDWIGSVGKSIVRCSSTYYRSNGQTNGQTNNNGGNQQLEGGNQGGQVQDDDDDLYSNDGNEYFND